MKLYDRLKINFDEKCVLSLFCCKNKDQSTSQLQNLKQHNVLNNTGSNFYIKIILVRIPISTLGSECIQ